MGMRRVVDRTYRVRVPSDTERPPRFWDVREYLPYQDHVRLQDKVSVYLGRSERLENERYTRAKEHRFFPDSGEWPRDFAYWTKGVQWLHEVYCQHHPEFLTEENTARELAAAEERRAEERAQRERELAARRREEQLRQARGKKLTLQDHLRKLLD